jgi:hypothetical protein
VQRQAVTGENTESEATSAEYGAAHASLFHYGLDFHSSLGRGARVRELRR